MLYNKARRRQKKQKVVPLLIALAPWRLCAKIWLHQRLPTAMHRSFHSKENISGRMFYDPGWIAECIQFEGQS